MTQTINKIIIYTALALGLLAPIAFATTTHAANIQDNLCAGANLEFSKSANCATSAGGATDKVNKTVSLGINIFSWVVGVAAVIMIIIGGLKYITSSGDSNNITSAKNTILYAIIGLIIVALAQFIVKFVLNATSTT